MSAFKEDLFFSGEVREALDKLKGLRRQIGESGSRALERGFDRKVRDLERLLFWFQRRQAVLRAPSPKPFLFSELKAELLDKIRENPDLFAVPKFHFKKDYYLMFRFTDLAEALLGVCGSLRAATAKETSLSFGLCDESVVAVIRFKAGFDDFDLKAFCQKLTWQTRARSDHDAGFPFLEAVVEHGKGSFNWRFGRGCWHLEITLPAMISS